MDKFCRDALRMIFKTKIRAFMVWYIFSCLVCVYYAYTKFYRIVTYPFFPIKLAPIVVAATLGEIFYCIENHVSYSVEESKRKFKRRVVALIVCIILVGQLFKFTGINLAWLLI